MLSPINNTAESDGISSGALLVKGGIGVEKNVSVGGNVNITDKLAVAGLLEPNKGINCDNGKFVVADGTGNTSIQGTLETTNATTLNNTLTVAEASTLNIASIYNSNSNKILNEKILDKFKLKIVDNNSIHNTITNEVESYDFYNKVCVYKKYKNTIPGLYYINNTYKGINKIELTSCDFNKITINSSDEYKAILFCNEEIIIHIN